MKSNRIIMMAVAMITGLLALVSPALAQDRSEVDAAIAAYSALYGLPESLAHRIIKRESKYNPRAYRRGHWGLTQIRYETAKTMGYRGVAKGLLNADTNLKFGLKYLAGAYLVAGGNANKAARYYRSGYYYVAKRKGLLEETGLKQKRW